mmetsp:Transcript_2177/g.6635  ORF Transcript_2177/g.6635 Transcript_2177/m.6635 type:complete len:235 (-) Transcript_2177:59-763(-)
MFARLAHAFENLHGLLQVPAFDARVDHAAIGHSVCLAPLLLHLAPDLEDLLQVTSLAVGLHQDPEGHGRRGDLELAHFCHDCLQAAEVLEPAASVEECVEEHLVHVLGLHVYETLDQRNAPVDTRRVEARPAVPHCLHEHPRHSVLICRDALPLHLFQGAPCLIHAFAAHELLQCAGRPPRLVAARVAIPRPAAARRRGDVARGGRASAAGTLAPRQLGGRLLGAAGRHPKAWR